MIQSKHVENFLVQVQELQNQLSVAESVLIIWMEVQKTWAYLESIFKSCDDICQHLPADLQRFQEVDNEFQVCIYVLVICKLNCCPIELQKLLMVLGLDGEQC